MEILVVILVLLAITRALGEAAVRVGQPALLGELVGGIVVGLLAHYTLGVFHAFADLVEDPAFLALTDLGAFFLMLLAGIEMKPAALTSGSKTSLGVAIGGMVLPLALGVGLGWLVVPESPYRPAQILFLGTALAITAVPVAAKILLDLGQLESRPGRTILAAALVDDVLSLVLLAALTGMIRSGELPDLTSLGLLALQIAGFFVITTAIGRYLLPRFLEPLIDRTIGQDFEFSLLLLVALAFGVLAEVMGMHFIIGSFVAGLFFGRHAMSDQIYEDVQAKVTAITSGFLAPIFFASIGLEVELTAFTAVPGFVVVLILVGLIGKTAGAAIPALIGGLEIREAATVGIGMSARGAVEIIIAGVALQAGLFSIPEPTPPVVANMFSAVVIMAVVTTLFTPIGLRWFLKERSNEG